MTTHLALAVAAMHGVLVSRPSSLVFHVALPSDLTRSRRSVRGSARPVCNAHTRRLTVLTRHGVTVDLLGRQVCGRCSARLSAVARRAEQPPSNVDQRTAFWQATGITSSDLVVALAITSSVEESYAIANVTNLLHGRVNLTAARRPVIPGKAQGRWDFEQELIRRRNQLRYAELTPEALDAAAAKREVDEMSAAQARVAHRRANAIARAIDRRNTGGYVTRYERDLIDSA